jgi:hypothetical protein
MISGLQIQAHKPLEGQSTVLFLLATLEERGITRRNNLEETVMLCILNSGRGFHASSQVLTSEMIAFSFSS